MYLITLYSCCTSYCTSFLGTIYAKCKIAVHSQALNASCSLTKLLSVHTGSISFLCKFSTSVHVRTVPEYFTVLLIGR